MPTKHLVTYALIVAGCSAWPMTAQPAASQRPIRIAVLDFELEDFSAAASTGAAPDTSSSLSESTAEAKRDLAASGRYQIVELRGADLARVPKGDLRDCDGCYAQVAAGLGADQVLLGVITKISMTEFRVQCEVRDARSRKVLNTYRTDLRVGAYYSWSRGVRWLIAKKVLQPA